MSKGRNALKRLGTTVLNVRWWSWAPLRCVWKLSNFSWDQSVTLQTQQREKIRITRC